MSFEEHSESSRNCTGDVFSDTQNSDCKNNEVVTSYICDRCGQSFQTKASVLSHIKWKHENPDSNRMCSVCQKIFTRKNDRDRHQKNCNNQITKKNTTCSLCDFQATNRKEVLSHYQVKHSINITKNTLNFNTFEEFKIWKQNFERETKSRFIKATGIHRTKGGVNMTKYKCHRDGNFQSKSKGIRRMKMIGSNKINSYCPANITVSETDQNVKVVYIDTHVGHELDLCYLTISESERAVIAQKIAMNIPFQQILDEIRDSIVDGELERIHLATRKDLWNIVDSYNLSHEAILQKNNYSSVEDWVSYIKKISNLVRFYKPQGEISEIFPQLREEDFFLVIMNDTQKEVLQKFGNDSVCIDGTQGLKAHDFQLHTVMVLDDTSQGFPCSFLFSNRTDSEAMKIFFETIKDCLNNTSIQPKTFISDMDDTIFNAWTAIMGPVQNRLICSWHVDRAWRRNLVKIKNKEKQAVVYKKIKIIMYEMDSDIFRVMVNNLLEELSSDIDCLEFFEYFETYVKKCTSWANCYRTEGEMNANMNLENLHRFLKHIYYGEKKVKRIDKVIITLMKYIRDTLFDRITFQSKRDISKKLTSIRQIHNKSLGLENTLIDLGDSWDVCATKSDDVYRVQAARTTCTCNLRCRECKACIHGYTCNCIEFSVKWNMCEHIHLICMFLKNNISIDKNLSDGEVISHEIEYVFNENVTDGYTSGEMITHEIEYVINDNVSDGYTSGEIITQEVKHETDENVSDGYTSGEMITHEIEYVINDNVSDGYTSGEIITHEIKHETDENVSDEDSGDKESAILSVVNKAKQFSFDKRKQDLMNNFLEVYNTVDSEEQLEAVLKQVAPLKSIVKELSNRNNLITKTWKEHPTKKLKQK